MARAVRRLPRRLDYTPGSYPATAVPSAPMLHLLSRFSYGVTPALVAEATAAGGQRAWFEAQLTNAYDGTAAAVADWWPDLKRSPLEIYARDLAGIRPAWQVMTDYVNRTLARRILSPRPVLEQVTDLLENHLHVPVNGNLVYPYRPQYGDLIRAGALGRFEDLLVGALQHPAMLMYLNAIGSTKAHPNENLARELLELHTVGVGNYTEADVKATARLMTGFLIDLTSGALTYNLAAHDTAPVSILGFTDTNADRDGRAAYVRLLRYLANHPLTARRLATKIVVRFVRDDPPAALVDRLAAVYLANGTAIAPVLRALVASDEFAASAGLKLRDPAEDVVNSFRILRANLVKPTTATSPANLLSTGAQNLGHAPFTWPSPDGQPQVAAAWATPARAAASLQLHTKLATLKYPAAIFATTATFLPPLPLAFRDLVDHLHRVLYQRPSTATVLQACCEATGVDPAASITSKHAVVGTGFATLLGALLDQPAFYQR
ncbi:DUF1800 domain-containing protein [Nocardioides fonticola]|uniref:DUF1800 domain-containing protein n=1 Tax=Nocardioides fonticola TaxID=450363 RepID=A0ABP7XIV3_9ACTN